MIRNYPHRGVQKLRSRSTLRVSLPLMMRFAAIAGTMYYFVALIERARSASGVISITNVTECVHICSAMCYIVDTQLITVLHIITFACYINRDPVLLIMRRLHILCSTSLLQYVTISAYRLHYPLHAAILEAWRKTPNSLH